ncbi:MAG: PQQ-binding-like beta-propeller repeat protein, partial [Planctomycetota bacterium]
GEIDRVLSPEGVACMKTDDGWRLRRKPWPEEIDDWTHYLHDSSGNPVSDDDRVGPPRGLQWEGSPQWSRHHEHMASVSALVSSGGRMFYIADRGSRKSILLPSRWYLVARDAFNGTVLWEREIKPWRSRLLPLKSGPAQMPRRLVAVDDTVYATMGVDAPVSALDAETGETIRTFPETEGTREIVVSDGTVFALSDSTPGRQEPDSPQDLSWIRRNRKQWWKGGRSRITALDADTGEVLWKQRSRVLPLTLAVEDGSLVYHDGEQVVCREADSGRKRWTSAPLGRTDKLFSFFGPSLVIHDDTVLFAGGEESGMQTGSWLEKDDSMAALSLESGEVLWRGSHPPSGYRSPEDLFAVGNRVYAGKTTSGHIEGYVMGRDLASGEVAKKFPPDVDTYWFHHRCYRGKATKDHLLLSRTGIEYVDPETGHWDINHWVRGGCLYGVMPANGLTYAPPHPCACYMVAKLNGFNALTASPALPDDALQAAADAERLVRGPAYDASVKALEGPADWTTYRHDMERSGSTPARVSSELEKGWRTSLGQDLSAVVAAGDRVFVSAVDSHTVYSLDADTGEVAWSFIAGGRVDSPPTIWRGRVLFGSADGRVYCLRATDGELIWKYRAAPADMRTMSYGQLESVWPLHGSVLVRDGTAYCVAGRSMFLDGGLRMLLLDAETGELMAENVMDENDPTTGKSLQAKIDGLNMPTALPDVLTADEDNIYMRSQKFNFDGKRVNIETPTNPDNQDGAGAHLFSASGLLDDSWFHRSYWVYGKTPLSGYSGYHRAARNAPAGRIIAFDDEHIYSYGRDPKYMQWTTPMEYQLFSSPRQDFRGSNENTIIQVDNSSSLNPAGSPLTVSAWVKPEKQSGAVVARGGHAHGYALYLEEGQPHFALRVERQVQSVDAGSSVSMKEWTHLAGVVTGDKKLKIYINGELAATDTTGGLVAADPNEAMQVGGDQGSPVGHYSGGKTFNGALDEVRIYREALEKDALRKLGSRADQPPQTDAEPVLYYGFDDGKPRDLSGHENHGSGGGEAVDGVFGRALRISGPSYPDYYEVKRRWTRRIPFYARAMVLADDTLFLAGPPDLVDEEEAVRNLQSKEVRRKLRRQAAAWRGEEGAYLWAVDEEGSKVTEYRLDSPPAWDGMAAAGGRLYIALQDGSLLCMSPGGSR